MADLIQQFVRDYGVLAIALLMLAETVFPPIPSEVIMPLAGLQAANGQTALIPAILAGTAGAMAGNILWYEVARCLGHDRLRRFVDRHGRWLTLDWKSVEKADRLFDRWSIWFVLIGRLIPTLRSLVSIPAGLFGMARAPFLICTAIGTLVWTGALAWAGYALGEQSDRIGSWLSYASNGIIALLAAWYILRVITWRKHPR
ncbi:DedA family protein [Sphingomonas sp. ID0503]|uniref:DedA family protein n=1 Tax=Sphingomonas sp. ID0503 TaxID=3399691 RepID=UPI003AFB4F57